MRVESLTEATSVEILKAKEAAEEARQEMKKMKSEMEAMKAALNDQKRYTEEIMLKQQHLSNQKGQAISPSTALNQRSSKF